MRALRELCIPSTTHHTPVFLARFFSATWRFIFSPAVPTALSLVRCATGLVAGRTPVQPLRLCGSILLDGPHSKHAWSCPHTCVCSLLTLSKPFWNFLVKSRFYSEYGSPVLLLPCSLPGCVVRAFHPTVYPNHAIFMIVKLRRARCSLKSPARAWAAACQARREYTL